MFAWQMRPRPVLTLLRCLWNLSKFVQQCWASSDVWTKPQGTVMSVNMELLLSPCNIFLKQCWQVRPRAMKGRWLRFSRITSRMNFTYRCVVEERFRNGYPQDVCRGQCVWGAFEMLRCLLFPVSSAYTYWSPLASVWNVCIVCLCYRDPKANSQAVPDIIHVEHSYSCLFALLLIPQRLRWLTWTLLLEPSVRVSACPMTSPSRLQWGVWKPCLHFITPPTRFQVNRPGGHDWLKQGHLPFQYHMRPEDR